MGNHRADRRDTRPVNSGARARGGRRRAAKAPRPELTGLPIPTVVGALALVVAAGGAVTAGTGQAWAQESSASTTNGRKAPTATELDTLGIDRSLDDRQRAISRDSERDAQRDAADEKLQRADESQARQRNAALASLAKSAERQASKIARNRWVLPTTRYHLTARFGMSGALWSSNHTGLDFAAPSGTPIVAVADGTITKTGYDGSYGNKTVETLKDGTEIWYCHQSAIFVRTGDRIRGGHRIGSIGSTGNVTGPHLHLEVRPGGGDPVDPYSALVHQGLRP
jgi:murein DD-endopeptidase MepM/ murein hydrolase activator NlpD